jgi:hypothetical protein
MQGDIHKKISDNCKTHKGIKFTLEQAMKTQEGSGGIALLFL